MLYFPPMAPASSAVKQAQPTDKTKRLYDERGLDLGISPAGGKRWRLIRTHKFIRSTCLNSVIKLNTKTFVRRALPDARPTQYRVLRINSQQRCLCHHRTTGCAAIASSLMSVPHPGRSGIVNIPFSIKGKSVTKSSRQGTSSTSISMIRKLGMAAQR